MDYYVSYRHSGTDIEFHEVDPMWHLRTQLWKRRKKYRWKLCCLSKDIANHEIWLAFSGNPSPRYLHAYFPRGLGWRCTCFSHRLLKSQPVLWFTSLQLSTTAMLRVSLFLFGTSCLLASFTSHGLHSTTRWGNKNRGCVKHELSVP